MKARIVMTGHVRGQIFLDGVEQKLATAFRLECSVDGLNLLTVETCHAVDDIEFEGEVERGKEP